MADLSLRYLLYGEDKTASKAIKGVGAQASSTGSLVSGGLSKMGNMLGGEVGDMLNRVSMGFDNIGTKSKSMSAKMVVGGTAVMGLGLAMQMMASKDVAAQQQLTAAVEATGKGYDAFGEDVERLIAKQVRFGHADDEVKTALRVLTTAYNDPKKALQEMTLVTDLAAAKHISLADAAVMVAKAHGGAARVFKEFGITVGTTAAGTKDYDGALTALSGKLKGQASASMDNFGGKVQQVKTWLENQATTISEKYGPAVTIAGGVVTAFGSVMQVMAARAAAAALAQDATAVSATRMSKAFALAGTAGRMLGGPLLIAAGALFYFAKQAADSSARVDELSQTLDAQTGAVTTNTRAWVAKTLSESGALESARAMGVSVADVTDAVLGHGDALARVNTALVAYGKSLAGNADVSSQIDAMKKLKAAIGGGNDELNRGVKQQRLLASATAASVTITAAASPKVQDLAKKQKELADATKTATDKINTYHQALVDAGLVVLSTRDAQRALIQSQVDATKAIADNGRGLNVHTQQGRDNAAALDTVAKNAIALGTATLGSTHSEAAMRASLAESRASLVKTYLQFDDNIGRAITYANSVLKIPDKAKTDILLAGAAAAKKKIDDLARSIRMQHNFPINLNFRVGTGATLLNTANVMNKLVGAQGRAVGGPALAGMPYIVGDGGRPELFVPDTNGTILPRVPVGATHTTGGRSGAAMNIERYYAGTQSAADVAEELSWKARR